MAQAGVVQQHHQPGIAEPVQFLGRHPLADGVVRQPGRQLRRPAVDLLRENGLAMFDLLGVLALRAKAWTCRSWAS